MRSIDLFLRTALLSYITVASAQQIQVIPAASDTFPQCAENCAILQRAQATCAATNTPGTIAQGLCFCAYGLDSGSQTETLQGLFYDAIAVCSDVCTVASDRELLKTWFNSYCRSVGTGTNPNNPNNPNDPDAKTGSTATITTTSAPTGTATSIAGAGREGDGGGRDANLTGSAWFKKYYPYVIMVIVLFVAFIAIGFFAVWLKRRIRRRREQKGLANTAFGFNASEPIPPVDREKTSAIVANANQINNDSQTNVRSTWNTNSVRSSGAATADLWGPHQQMAATNGYQYTQPGTDPDSQRNSLNGSLRIKDRNSVSERYGSGMYSSQKNKPTDDVQISQVSEEPEIQSIAAGATARSTSRRPRPSELDRELRAAESKRDGSKDGARKSRNDSSTERRRRDEES